MALRCYKCGIYLVDRKYFITHLRKDHLLTDHCEAMNCGFIGCSRTFLTFSGISAHLKSHDHQILENVCCSL